MFASKHWACSRADIDWKAEGIRSSALEFVAYSLGFFHDGHRDAISSSTALASTLSPSCGGSGGLRWPVILHRTPYGITAADAPDETDITTGWRRAL